MVESELDIGIVSLPVRHRELVVTAFHDDELVAIAPAARGRPARTRIGAVDLAREPLVLFEHGGNVRRVIDAWFHAAGVAPAAPMELGNTEAIKKLVEAGVGLSITSWFAVRAEVAAGQLVRAAAGAAAGPPHRRHPAPRPRAWGPAGSLPGRPRDAAPRPGARPAGAGARSRLREQHRQHGLELAAAPAVGGEAEHAGARSAAS